MWHTLKSYRKKSAENNHATQVKLRAEQNRKKAMSGSSNGKLTTWMSGGRFSWPLKKLNTLKKRPRRTISQEANKSWYPIMLMNSLLHQDRREGEMLQRCVFPLVPSWWTTCPWLQYWHSMAQEERLHPGASPMTKGKERETPHRELPSARHRCQLWYCNETSKLHSP